MDISSLNSYTSNIGSGAYSAEADRIKSMAGGISKDSSYEDLEKAAKQFSSYLLEQTLKEAKKSIDEINKEENDEEDSYAAQTKDLFMDQTIQAIAASMADQVGQRFTKELADQMARSSGVEIPGETKGMQEANA